MKNRLTLPKIRFFQTVPSLHFTMMIKKKLRGFIALLKPVSEKIGAEVGTDEAKLEEKASMQVLDSYSLAMKGDYAGATAKAEEAKTTLGSVRNATKTLGDYHSAMALY
jgi:hypothetical protein